LEEPQGGVARVIDSDPVAACVREIMAERTMWLGARQTFCARVRMRQDMARRRGAQLGQKISGRSPAGCGRRRRSCARWASRLNSVVRAEPGRE